MNDERVNSERQLWQRLSDKGQAGPDSAHLDPNLLAAYVEGRVNQAQAIQVERAMAGDAALLDTVIAMRGVARVSGGEEEVVPDSVLTRAKALVSQGRGVVGENPSHRDRLVGQWQRGVRWAAAAVIVLAVGLTGYRTGDGTYRHEVSAASVVDEEADGFIGLDDDDSLLFVGVAGEELQ